MRQIRRPSLREISSSDLLNEINTTPLVDVMLVLLIIFLITIPVVGSSIDVNLPVENNTFRNLETDSVVITALSSGVFVVGETSFNTNTDNFLQDYFRELALIKPQPEVHIRADKDMLFESLGQLLKLLQVSGIKKVAFLTEPSKEL